MTIFFKGNHVNVLINSTFGPKPPNLFISKGQMESKIERKTINEQKRKPLNKNIKINPNNH